MFKKMSLDRFGQVAIDGLRRMWFELAEHYIRFPGFPEPPDVRMVREQWHDCVPGTEYLVANPWQVHHLQDLIQSCRIEDQICKFVGNSSVSLLLLARSFSTSFSRPIRQLE